MGCFGFRESRRHKRELQHELNIYREREIQRNLELQRQHELEMLKASKPTTGENIVTGIKWIFGSVAAIIILPPALVGAGAGATVAAVTAGAKALGG